jgi:hypothetical protein
MKKMTTFTLMAVLLMAGSAFAEIKFLPAKQGPGDPKYYAKKPDLAIIEATAPLSMADRMSLTPDALKKMNQEQLDQIYARLQSGPIPVGDFTGTVLIKNETIMNVEQKLLKSLFEKSIWGVFGKIALAGICWSRDRMECLAEFLWYGKRFYAPNEHGEIQLRNAVSTKIRTEMLLNKAGLGMMIEPLKQAPVQKFGRDDKLMLFPAHVYCGLSFIDTRHESVIIDYAYGDDFKPFIPEIDSLVGRDGKWIRDEIRMIRPGLYLGRAYMDRIFLLNFVLENKEISKTSGDAKAWKNKCWTGDSWQ